MKNLVEHNSDMFIKIERWLVKDKEERKKDAEILCYECGEKMRYNGDLRHRVGPFYNINVSCPNPSCTITGVKIVKALVPLEKIKDLLK